MVIRGAMRWAASGGLTAKISGRTICAEEGQDTGCLYGKRESGEKCGDEELFSWPVLFNIRRLVALLGTEVLMKKTPHKSLSRWGGGFKRSKNSGFSFGWKGSSDWKGKFSKRGSRQEEVYRRN